MKSFGNVIFRGRLPIITMHALAAIIQLNVGQRAVIEVLLDLSCCEKEPLRTTDTGHVTFLSSTLSTSEISLVLKSLLNLNVYPVHFTFCCRL